MTELRDAWYDFELEEFPPECMGRTVEGMSWEQVDAIAAACISTFIEAGSLDADCVRLLDRAILHLVEITAIVDDEQRPYFEKLLGFARQARASVK